MFKLFQKNLQKPLISREVNYKGPAKIINHLINNTMYYLLNYSIQNQKKDIWFSGTIYDNNQKVVKQIFNKGSVLKESEIQSPFTIIIDEKESSIKNKKPTDKISTTVIGSGFLFLISPAVRALFEEQKIDNLQYFDVTIKSSVLEFKDYKIVNIIDKIDCTDFSASDLELTDDGDIDMISELVLDESKIPKGKQIFLLGKKETGVIIIHEALKEAIEEANLTGFHFVELENAGELY